MIDWAGHIDPSVVIIRQAICMHLVAPPPPANHLQENSTAGMWSLLGHSSSAGPWSLFICRHLVTLHL
jgi:hypothetical protein